MLNASRHGKARLPADEVARREAHACELIAQGYRAKDVERMSGLWGGVAALRKRLGLRYAPARRPSPERAALSAEREAVVLALLRGGHTSAHIVSAAKVTAQTVARIRKAHGLPKLPPGGKAGQAPDVSRMITRMSHAQLDALEADVAAKRALGLLPSTYVP
jgi:hypothetical protein